MSPSKLVLNTKTNHAFLSDLGSTNSWRSLHIITNLFFTLLRWETMQIILWNKSTRKACLATFFAESIVNIEAIESTL